MMSLTATSPGVLTDTATGRRFLEMERIDDDFSWVVEEGTHHTFLAAHPTR